MISITGPAIVSFLTVTDETVEFCLIVSTKFVEFSDHFFGKKSYSNLQPLV